jgi:uncharacterized coiled-coil protein SlyX
VNASTEADRAKAETGQLIAKATAEADEILAEARAEAEKSLARTREEVAALQEEAESRLRELHADITTTWKERRELLDDVRGIATRLQEAASRAAARVPRKRPPSVPKKRCWSPRRLLRLSRPRSQRRIRPTGWKSRKTRSIAGGSTGTGRRNQFALRCSALAALAPNRAERTRNCNPRLGGRCGLIAPRR